MGRIYLTRVQLTDFRNWASLSLDCDRRHVVLVGENGAGKTNILEAISFLSPGRGLRRAAYDTIARNSGSGTWSVFARLEGFRGDVGIGTGIQPGPDGSENQRRIRIDGNPVKTGDELLDHARIVWLIPAMDGLFTGPAADRRRFLDRLVLAIDPAHGRRVADYERSMRSRNRLLGEYSPDRSWLDAIEDGMAATGVAITLARLELIGLLQDSMNRAGESPTPFPTASIALAGAMTELDGDSASDLEAGYLAMLREQRSLDAAAGRTGTGPHRSDLAVVHASKNIDAARCSTGEQKALLVGIMLAHAGLVAEMAGAAPILLLDEIAAHLDTVRRAALFDRIDALDCQAWMTGTDASLFGSIGDRGVIWRVADNRVVME